MPGKHGIICAAIALLLITAALAAVSGCTSSRRAEFAPEGSQTAEQTPSVAATATGGAGAQSEGGAGASSSGSGGSSGSGAGSGPSNDGSSASKLSTKEAGSLDAELSAIQSELDRLSVPGDSDFDSIGSGLE